LAPWVFVVVIVVVVAVFANRCLLLLLLLASGSSYQNVVVLCRNCITGTLVKKIHTRGAKSTPRHHPIQSTLSSVEPTNTHTHTHTHHTANSRGENQILKLSNAKPPKKERNSVDRNHPDQTHGNYEAAAAAASTLSY